MECYWRNCSLFFISLWELYRLLCVRKLFITYQKFRRFWISMTICHEIELQPKHYFSRYFRRFEETGNNLVLVKFSKIEAIKESILRKHQECWELQHYSECLMKEREKLSQWSTWSKVTSVSCKSNQMKTSFPAPSFGETPLVYCSHPLWKIQFNGQFQTLTCGAQEKSNLKLKSEVSVQAEVLQIQMHFWQVSKHHVGNFLAWRCPRTTQG